MGKVALLNTKFLAAAYEKDFLQARAYGNQRTMISSKQ